MIAGVFLVFAVCLVISVPIVTSLGVATIWPALMRMPGAASFQAVIRAIFGGADSIPIIAVPLFILAGVLMARGGISKKLFNVFAFFIGRRTAGMPCAAIITCLFYGAISGSGPATAAAVGAMTIPILVELGYDKVFCAAMIASAGSLGVVIPPSIPFVLYGLCTSSSVGSLFIAGILPGILIGLFLMVYAYVYCKIRGEDKEKISANYEKLRERGFFSLFIDSFWALMSPVIILGGIYSGFFTPTEAACISVFYSLLVSLFIYKTIRMKEIWGLVTESVRGYAPICFILALANAFGRVMTLLRVPQAMSEFLTTNFSSPFAILFAILILFFLLGMVMDTGPAIVIMAPILLPSLVKFEIDPIHVGVIMVANLAIGLVTPPFGLNLFVVAPMIDTPVMTVGKKSIPFIGAFFVALALITFIPGISLFLLG
jgi:C4-dicarboxylate transporter DctM subunit